jgi:serine/threonine protein kinase
MAGDPIDLGFMSVTVPGYMVEDLLGIGAFSTVFKARVIESTNIVTKQQKQRQQEDDAGYWQETCVSLPSHLMEHEVCGDGNCFFHAVAHQLQSLNCADKEGNVYTHDLLREIVLSHVGEESQFRLMMTDEEFSDLSRLNGYVNHGAIAALANVLEVNVAIYGAPNALAGEATVINADGNIDLSVSNRPTVTLVYNGHNHYNSVTDRQDVSQVPRSNVRKRKRKCVPRSGFMGKTWYCSTLPVAVKIFQEKHRGMCVQEKKVLEEIGLATLNNNIPTVVQSLDVCGRPALVVSPAGNNVLPVHSGVRARKTEFVKLLQVLEDAHKLKICHRDVKPHNIFIDETGRVILNDWSSAVEAGTDVPWVGTPAFYDKPLCESHSPQPSDDLVALVRSVYAMYTNELPIMGTTNNLMEQSVIWSKALQYARECNYNKLRRFFNEL